MGVLGLVVLCCLFFTGGVCLRVAVATRKKAPPPDPHRENFNNLGQGVDYYDCAETLLLLIVRYHRGAPPNGTLLPNRRLGLTVVV